MLTALGATPVVLRRLVERIDPADPLWDVQEPGRFTPREHVAHMADWEEVFFDRMRLSVEQDAPIVPNPNETALSIEHGYATSIPLQKVDLFAERRRKLIEYLNGRREEDWQRVGVHPKNGPMSLEAQAVHVLGHDGYHLAFLAPRLVSLPPD